MGGLGMKEGLENQFLLAIEEGVLLVLVFFPPSSSSSLSCLVLSSSSSCLTERGRPGDHSSFVQG